MSTTMLDRMVKSRTHHVTHTSNDDVDGVVRSLE